DAQGYFGAGLDAAAARPAVAIGAPSAEAPGALAREDGSQAARMAAAHAQAADGRHRQVPVPARPGGEKGGRVRALRPALPNLGCAAPAAVLHPPRDDWRPPGRGARALTRAFGGPSLSVPNAGPSSLAITSGSPRTGGAGRQRHGPL